MQKKKLLSNTKFQKTFRLFLKLRFAWGGGEKTQNKIMQVKQEITFDLQ